MELCRCSYIIMGILRKKNATNKIQGLTIKELHELEKITKPNTIHKKVKALEELGYIQEGVRAGKAKTYFLTEAGSNNLPTKKESA